MPGGTTESRRHKGKGAPGSALTSGAQSATWLSLARAFDPLEACLIVACIVILLPGTWLTVPFTSGSSLLLSRLHVAPDAAPTMYYAAWFGLLLLLLCRTIYAGCVSRSYSPALGGLVTGVCMLASVYLLDFFVSTANPYDFDACMWSLQSFAVFLVIFLCLQVSQTMRLARLVAVATGAQALCGIYFYIIGSAQLYTPGFGNRTGGTFLGPNMFYPVCLVGAPLCIALWEAQTRRWPRILFGAAATANLFGLTFTYMRSGWLGMAAAAVYLLLARRSLWKLHPYRRVASIVLLLLLVGGTLFVRTYGAVIGTSGDRSTLGRIQIWRSSLSAIAAHPWLGTGVSTYAAAQSAHMTPALQSFDPLNTDAKSLYLNTATEIGLVGFALLGLAVWRYGRCVRDTLAKLAENTESRAVVIGTTAGVVALGVAGLTDTPVMETWRVPGTFALAVLLGAVAAIARDTLPAPVASYPTQRLRRVGWAALTVVLAVVALTAVRSLVLIREAEPSMDHYVAKLLAPPPAGPARPLPGAIKDAIIAAEDRNFYQHDGVDWEALHHVMSEDLRFSGSWGGGSTITMQAVRYTMLPYDKTPARKIAQIVLARRLERRIGKSAIMRLYFDSVSFGLHAAGLKHAARIYFDKRPEALTLGECAFLVGVISKPPRSIAEVTPQFAAERISFVLHHMETVFPGKYDVAAMASVFREPLHFAWEKTAETRKELP